MIYMYLYAGTSSKVRALHSTLLTVGGGSARPAFEKGHEILNVTLHVGTIAS